MNRIAPWAWIVLAGVALFGPFSTAYFCGFDDFADIHRAAFEDTRDPARIFTTTHWGTSKYRPLQRGFTYVCWLIGRGSAFPFRLRNLFFHVSAAVLLYAIALLATRDKGIALGAGLLFVIHPLANQSVVAAIWTNTAAYALMLASFYLFQRSLHRNQPGLLTAAMAVLLAALFFYEAVIVVAGMMVLYLAVWKARGERITGRYLAAFGGGLGVVLVLFGVIRHEVVSSSTPLVPFGQIARNLAMYAGALISPVDSVLANSLLETPLPPDIQLSRQLLAVAGAVVACFVLLLFLVLRTVRMRARLASLDWVLAAFLICCIVGALVPFLAFTPHPSETYLYLPAALFSILLCLVLRALLSSKAYVVVLSILGVLFVSASLDRNQRVSSCAAIAKNILRQLPVAEWKQGDWHIQLQSEPPGLRRYGIYGYDGLYTIDSGEPKSLTAQEALQIVTGNEHVRADVLPPKEFERGCPAADPCFWISRRGDVEKLH